MNPEETELAEDMSVDDALASLMQELPKPVRDFLISNERAEIARELSAKYGLHVDQAAEFEQAYLHMLLGIATPEEFTASLRKAGLTQDVISGLSADINSRVFMRLRDAERELSGQPTVQQTAQKPAPLPPPALEYRPANLPGSPVQAPMPTSPAIQTSGSAVVAPIVPIEPVPAPQQHVVHATPNTHQPGWHPAAAVHIFVPAHGPATHPAYTQAPAPAAPVPQEPVSAPAPQPLYVNPVEPAATPIPPSPTPLEKDYAADPYREPLQ